MREASELARRIPPAMFREEVISQQVCVDLAISHLAAAQELLKTDGFIFEPDFRFPDLPYGTNVPHTAGLLDNSALRLPLYQGRGKGDLEN